ncbi:MAG: hypothetical protein JNJ46_25265 [Myxococcales bacterium]|nr:hypothetical protein [Myxococcales bacterium]
MFRLARFIVSTFILALVIWFAVTVPIGKHTLWGHLRRIASTPEAKDLATGAKQVAKDAVERAQREVQDDNAGSASRPTQPQPER